jgi:aspartate racemase
MSDIRTLGVLGGMGPEATAVFFRRVVAFTDAHRDQDHVPMLLLNDTAIPDRTGAILSGRAEEVYERMLPRLRFLEENGCAAVAIPCNTSHYFADRFQKELSIPLVNMVRETATRVAAHGGKKVGILATDGTVKTGIYQREFSAWGLTPVLPSEPRQREVMALIYDDIKSGMPGSPARFEDIHGELLDAGCDCAILACTELSCFAEEQRLPSFYVDAMDVLVEQSILACGGKLKRSQIH